MRKSKHIPLCGTSGTTWQVLRLVGAAGYMIAAVRSGGSVTFRATAYAGGHVFEARVDGDGEAAELRAAVALAGMCGIDVEG